MAPRTVTETVYRGELRQMRGDHDPRSLEVRKNIV